MINQPPTQLQIGDQSVVLSAADMALQSTQSQTSLPTEMPCLSWQLTLGDEVPAQASSIDISSLAPIPLTSYDDYFGVPEVVMTQVNLISTRSERAVDSNTSLMLSTVRRFGSLNYSVYARPLVFGFCREFEQQGSSEQRLVALCFPEELQCMCLQFYMEAEIKYFQVARTLRDICQVEQRDSNNNNDDDRILINGRNMVDLILRNRALHLDLAEHSLPYNCEKDAIALCDPLLRHRLIELVSYKTSFLSLFDKPRGKREFESCADCVYAFVPSDKATPA